jgi:hypothetical protein
MLYKLTEFDVLERVAIAVYFADAMHTTIVSELFLSVVGRDQKFQVKKEKNSWVLLIYGKFPPIIGRQNIMVIMGYIL